MSGWIIALAFFNCAAAWVLTFLKMFKDKPLMIDEEVISLNVTRRLENHLKVMHEKVIQSEEKLKEFEDYKKKTDQIVLRMGIKSQQM